MGTCVCTHLHIRAHTSTCATRPHMHTQAHVHVPPLTHRHAHIHTHTPLYIPHTCMHMHARTRAHTPPTCTHAHPHTYTRGWVHSSAHTSPHTHTQFPQERRRASSGLQRGQRRLPRGKRPTEASLAVGQAQEVVGGSSQSLHAVPRGSGEKQSGAGKQFSWGAKASVCHSGCEGAEIPSNHHTDLHVTSQSMKCLQLLASSDSHNEP